MFLGTPKTLQNLSRSKQIAWLNEMTFCIMSFLEFLPKADLIHIPAQCEKTMLLLFTVVLSALLSGNVPKLISGRFQNTLFLKSKTNGKPSTIQHRKQVKSCLSTHTVLSLKLTPKTTPKPCQVMSKSVQKQKQHLCLR